MSSYNDINRLLDQIGANARSAGDPWTLSRTYRGLSQNSSFKPSVIGDMGAPLQDLSAGIQSSEQITHADNLASSQGAASQTSGSSGGSGLLGGLLNFFPLASGIAKLFGFGGSSAPTAPTPFELPPSINFEGAVSSNSSGITSLSYGANGVPRSPDSLATPTKTYQPPVTASSLHAADGLGALSNGTRMDSSFAEPVSPYADVVAHLDRLAGSGAATGGLAEAATVGPIADSASTSNLSDRDAASQFAMLAASEFSANLQPANQLSDAADISSQQLQYAGSTNFAMLPGSLQNSIVPGAVNSSGAPFNSNSNSSSEPQGHSILVQVQAMDSQSFMDRSGDIAQAVRQAMLNMNSLNDTILDL